MEGQQYRKRDRNGTATAVSVERNGAGIYQTIHYATGSVTQFLPNRVVEQLLSAIEYSKREEAHVDL